MAVSRVVSPYPLPSLSKTSDANASPASFKNSAGLTPEIRLADSNKPRSSEDITSGTKLRGGGLGGLIERMEFLIPDL